MANQPTAVPAELLQQLAPLHQPAPISNWPIAPGWWLLAILIVIAIAIVSYRLHQRTRRRRYRKQACEALANHWQHYQHQHNLPALMKACNQLLKQVAITAYGREKVAPLTGQAWHQFLLKQHPSAPIQLPDDYFAVGQYHPQPAVTADMLKDFTYSWINHHHA